MTLSEKREKALQLILTAPPEKLAGLIEIARNIMANSKRDEIPGYSIYGIRCKVNGKLYIGSTSNLRVRISQHFSELRRGKKTVGKGNAARPTAFQEDYDRFGESAFEVYVLENDVPWQRATEREAYWIGEYSAVEPEYGYNRRKEVVNAVPAFVEGLPPKARKEA